MREDRLTLGEILFALAVLALWIAASVERVP